MQVPSEHTSRMSSFRRKPCRNRAWPTEFSTVSSGTKGAVSRGCLPRCGSRARGYGNRIWAPAGAPRAPGRAERLVLFSMYEAPPEPYNAQRGHGSYAPGAHVLMLGGTRSAGPTEHWVNWQSQEERKKRRTREAGAGGPVGCSRSIWALAL